MMLIDLAKTPSKPLRADYLARRWSCGYQGLNVLVAQGAAHVEGDMVTLLDADVFERGPCTSG